MQATPTKLNDVFVLEPKIFGDERGFFFESYSDREFERLGLPTRFVQDNHSKSVKGVLRGIHYQLVNPQGKLVRVLQGEVFDVAVDLRRGSPQFGQWIGERLSAENRKMLWIPPGFGHAFLVLSDTAEFAYKASEFYTPSAERTLMWNDPDVAIAWPLNGEPIISTKDQAGHLLKDAEVYELAAR